MLSTTNQIFQYNGSPIAFQKGNSVMANATQMAKPFEKSPKDWLRTKLARDFMSSLSAVRLISLTDLVQVKQGGDIQGTWMHEDVALEFARWLSPAFAIWCNDRIKELLTKGVTVASNDDEAILHAMEVLQRRVERQKQRVQMLEGQNQAQEEQIQELAPKAEYTDTVLQSTSTYTMTQVAKEFGMSAHRFGLFLKAKRIMFYQSGQWLLTAKYQAKGYTKPRTHHYTARDGHTGSHTITVWTEKGRAFLHAKLGKEVLS